LCGHSFSASSVSEMNKTLDTTLTAFATRRLDERYPYLILDARYERAREGGVHVRPVYHWLEDRVRAHVFLCMLAYYLEWHMRQKLAPMLFDDTDKEEAEARRQSVVTQARRSKAAVKKQTTGPTEDGLPVHSFRSLLADLATLARNTITTAISPHYPLTVLTRPTPVQQKAFDLLGIKCAQ
jgi:Transposase, Mutator family